MPKKITVIIEEFGRYEIMELLGYWLVVSQIKIKGEIKPCYIELERFGSEFAANQWIKSIETSKLDEIRISLLQNQHPGTDFIASDS